MTIYGYCKTLIAEQILTHTNSYPSVFSEEDGYIKQDHALSHITLIVMNGIGSTDLKYHYGPTSFLIEGQ